MGNTNRIVDMELVTYNCQACSASYVVALDGLSHPGPQSSALISLANIRDLLTDGVDAKRIANYVDCAIMTLTNFPSDCQHGNRLAESA